PCVGLGLCNNISTDQHSQDKKEVYEMLHTSKIISPAKRIVVN
ncbi:MAG: hypothetical protein ACI85F_001809, partial [Bacteroidia bacterium]